MKNGGKQNVRGVKIWGKNKFFCEGSEVGGQEIKERTENKNGEK